MLTVHAVVFTLSLSSINYMQFEIFSVTNFFISYEQHREIHNTQRKETEQSQSPGSVFCVFSMTDKEYVYFHVFCYFLIFVHSENNAFGKFASFYNNFYYNYA